MNLLNLSDTLTLQAFLLALSQVDTTLPRDLQLAIHGIGHDLTRGETDVADKIRDLVQRHARLNQLYQESCDNLQEHYKTQERAQKIMRMKVPESATLNWEAVAIPILTADDFRAAAEQTVKQLKSQKDLLRNSTDIKVFVGALQKAVSAADAEAIAVLKALEKRPLTTQDLVYVIGLSSEQSWTLVQSLWREGYVERTTGNMLYKIFPMLRDRRHITQAIDFSTYLTITSKGHFFLHPVVTFGRQKDVM